MSEWRLGEIESRFADLIWKNEPITSAELVRLAQQELNWKKSTTYTVLKRLSQKGVFQNQEGTVTSLVSRETFYTNQSRQFVEESFGGSLPAFLAAFTRQKKMTQEEIAQLQELIDGLRR